MSATGTPTPDVDVRTVGAIVAPTDTRSLPGETGMVEAPRRKWLPFSPWHFLLMPIAIVMLVPLVWVVMTSFETLAQTQHFPPILWPGTFQWHNYPSAFTSVPFARWFWNTTIVTTVVVISNPILCSLAAYGFARIKFLGKGVAYFFLLATLLVPLQVVLIPTFLIVKQMHLLNTLGALIVPNLANVFGIFLLTQFFRTLPIELEEGSADRRREPPEDPVLDRPAAVAAGVGHPGRDPVPLDVERLPVAARDDLQGERVHAAARG